MNIVFLINKFMLFKSMAPPFTAVLLINKESVIYKINYSNLSLIIIDLSSAYIP